MITTGKVIYTVLSTNAAVVALVGTKIFPLVIPEKTTLPCIVYERSFANDNTKDGLVGSDSTINLTVISTDYSNSIAICEAIHAALKGYTSANIRRVQLSNGAETYLEGAYVQNLSYTVKGV